MNRQARHLIERDAVRWSPRETGGPLFGYDNLGELVITRAFLPGPAAWHFPWLYRPDRAAVQAAIDEMYEQTEGQERWIGSWHSHPLGRPLPSLLDRRTAAAISREETVICPEPVMLIQTTRLDRDGQRPGSLGAFRWHAEAKGLTGLKLRSM
ncbi:MAG: Mov34/MPN/PAD-1 family protein [Solirubrobacteraceae bacterium]